MEPVPERVPTIDDLRVKLCWICRDEEYHDQPSEPRVQWVHPCRCTLIAHESCLLNWIRSAQQDASRSPNALKCPQCGARYEIRSENPFPLRLLNHINTSISLAGRAVTVFGFATVVVSCGFGMYVMLTSYGAYAVQEFLGKEMFDLLLTDDPTNWPWHAFINLPLIPISLVATRTKYFDTAPVFPLYLAWTTSPVAQIMTDKVRLADLASYPQQALLRWPPSPIMVSFCLPIVARLYRRLMRRVRGWVLGPQPAQDLPLRRIELALNEGGPALHVRIAADLNAPDGAHRQGAAAPAPVPAPAPAPADDQQQQQQQQQQPPANNLDDPVAAAEQTVRVTGTSLGRFIGGALMIPKLSNWMGAVLLGLSRHSVLLRRLLGVRPPLRLGAHSPRVRYGNAGWPPEGGLLHQLGTNLRVVLNVICGGTKVWAEADPVWWRNTVGLGIFVFAKDCLGLLHVYLTKREIESRRIKNKSFAGIDPRELDLIDRPAPNGTAI
ncbi:uncharacterized protein PHACADRAFT_261299 [Phanerochaete carnosa HHB-10118-sp]|uniref:RING-CH-type domain-containing protein n=1 Tax=Phanerochaete carnosa (strain HHB-10118-sp) TaxID=650164 RepID=K5W0S9_PHACS|nr:uncharacterized protein PHACADRAFT_261299 [Phanerochaete carnosa HHB-10118-sp]EKM52705.1 hypothetical protein PHACADRAFT_261299 [Phanerochaete carnosa HHB-10118-sp]